MLSVLKKTTEKIKSNFSFSSINFRGAQASVCFISTKARKSSAQLQNTNSTQVGSDITISFQVICLVRPADWFGNIGRCGTATGAAILRQKVRQCEGLPLLVLLFSC